MNRNDRGILIGMVLGDGSLSCRQRLKDGKYPYISAELTLKHSAPQRLYLEHKVALINRMFGGHITVRDFTVMIGGKRFHQSRAQKSDKYFRVLHRVFYSSGKYTITRRLLDWLTPEGLAIWYMDDGSARAGLNKDGWVTSCSTDLSVCCSHEEALIIQAYFRARHDIDVRVFRAKRDKEYWSISMNTANSQKFARIVAPYVVDCMRYKLAHVSNLNVQECRTPAKSCSVCGKPAYNTDRKRGLCDVCYCRDIRAKRKQRDDIVRPNGTTTV